MKVFGGLLFRATRRYGLVVRTIDSDVQISISPRSIRGTASYFCTAIHNCFLLLLVPGDADVHSFAPMCAERAVVFYAVTSSNRDRLIISRKCMA